MKRTPLSSAEITDLVTGLNKLARNLWWTWNQEAQDIFQQLSPRAWQNLYHNAVAVLHEVSDHELRARLQDRDLAEKTRDTLNRFEAYINNEKTWAHQHAPSLVKNPIAYFSAEFGFHESLPIAAGGLGVLAADHTRSASDLGLGLCGISLFYREGYFQQDINHENWQVEYYSLLNPKNLSMQPVLNAKGEPLVSSVEIAMNRVYFQAWQINVGRCPVYLLDTNRPENEQRFQDLTLRVYGGDSTTRVMQEILLGIGGVRFLRELGILPSVYHMNEGHAAFLVLELIREKMAEGRSFDEARQASTAQCLFTTHTPVEAGHDRFNADLMEYALYKLQKDHLKLPFKDFMGLGRVKPDDDKEPFCMTVLGMKHSRAINGVSELHGQITRQMWHPLFPDRAPEHVPIGHITNGVHLESWMKGTVRRYWRQKLGPDWDQEVNTPEFWQRMEDPEFISDEELWALRYALRRELIEFARRRLQTQEKQLRANRDHFIAFDHVLNPDALTIGFARRFATYKRASLIFNQFDKIVALARDRERPIQFIFAGKAHPKDDEGKRLIQHIIHLSKFSDLHGHLVFLENYDVHIARQMVSGCDVWLNNPRRPLEASGTSGQKVSCHGGLNLSIMDGWWREAYDGGNGFAIGDDSNPDNVEEQDRRDSENLYRVLTEEVIPCFFERDATGIPRRWLKMMRHAMATLVPRFNTWRMLQDYVNNYYLESKE